MKYFLIVFSLLALSVQAQNISNNRKLFDFDWRFHKGGADGAENINFNDSKWRKLDLPHDWSIEDLPGTNSPFNQDAINQYQGGFTTGGTGWYRKRFSVSEYPKDKKFILQFDGVYMNSEIWLNGKCMYSHPYGYTSFWLDITSFLKKDGANVLAVKVMNEGKNSRWYSGSGIYRHVWLTAVSPVHVANWGTYITTPEVNSSKAKVNIGIDVVNQGTELASVKVVNRIFNSQQKEVGIAEMEQSIAAGATTNVQLQTSVISPELWSVESPSLYKSVTEVYQNGVLTDQSETTFGIRSISFDSKNGFLLNGKMVKLKGGCVHHDNGPLGARAFDRAEERKIQLLKASGFNAIRCSHNPPSPAFLDACDRLGMLVIDEAFDMWKDQKNTFDYQLYFNNWWKKDIESMVNRDRNHPSVIFWSIGNEILNMDKPEVASTAKMLSAYVHQLDSTRPVTAAVNFVIDEYNNFIEALDVVGYNYSRYGYVSDHTKKPGRVMMATESFPLDAFDYWMDVEDYPWVIGDFVWTAFDYIGEAGIGWIGAPNSRDNYPWTLGYTGDIDLCGSKRAQSYYRDALWMKNQLSVFVAPPTSSFPLPVAKESWTRWEWQDVVQDWNWKGFENRPFDITVYSSCDEVELFLNEKSLGKKPTNRSTRFIANWKVPYNEGALLAIGYTGGKKVNTSELKTSGNAVQMKHMVDRAQIKADGQDLAYINIEITDAKGNHNPKADTLLKFEIEGPGTIEGVGNANPMSVESYQAHERKAWRGRCLVVIKSNPTPGKIKLTVSGEGLKPAIIEIYSVL